MNKPLQKSKGFCWADREWAAKEKPSEEITMRWVWWEEQDFPGRGGYGQAWRDEKTCYVWRISPSLSACQGMGTRA